LSGNFRNEICDLSKFSGVVGVSRRTNLYLASSSLLMGEKCEKIKEFWSGNFISNLQFVLV